MWCVLTDWLCVVIVVSSSVLYALLYMVLSAVLFQFEFATYANVPANDISVWYQFPQYIVITAGEVLFAVTGLSFAYSQVIITAYCY